MHAIEQRERRRSSVTVLPNLEPAHEASMQLSEELLPIAEGGARTYLVVKLLEDGTNIVGLET